MATLSSSNYRIKEGYLVKRGHIVKSWKKRFFVLDNTSLTYYGNAGDSKSKGTINLAYARIVSNPHSSSSSTTGTASSGSKPNYLLQSLWSSSSSSSSSASSSVTPSTSESSSSSTGTSSSTILPSDKTKVPPSSSTVPQVSTATGIKGYTFTIIENGSLVSSVGSPPSSSISKTTGGGTISIGEEWGLPGSDKRSGRLSSLSSSNHDTHTTTSSTTAPVTEYLLSAETEQERQVWIDLIQYNIQLYQSINNPNNNGGNGTTTTNNGSNSTTTTLSTGGTGTTTSSPFKETIVLNTKNIEKFSLLNNDSIVNHPTIDTSISSVTQGNDPHTINTLVSNNKSILDSSAGTIISTTSSTDNRSSTNASLSTTPNIPNFSSHNPTTDLPSSLYIFTGTWNMAEELPPPNIPDWIPKDADVYAISLQECMHTDAVLMAIHRHIGSSYIEIHHRIGATMKGLGFHGHIVLAVYVRDWMVTRGICRLSKAVRGSVALGRNLYLTRAANKGAVAISLPIRLPDNTGALTVTSALVFLSCHLTSDSHGNTKVDKRNRDARKMLDSLGLSLTTSSIDRARSQVLAAKFTHSNVEISKEVTPTAIKDEEKEKDKKKDTVVVNNLAKSTESLPPPTIINARAARVAAIRTNHANDIPSVPAIPPVPITVPSKEKEPSSAVSSSSSSSTGTSNSILIDNTNMLTDSTTVEAIADLLGIDEDEDDEEINSDEEVDVDDDGDNYGENVDNDDDDDEGGTSGNNDREIDESRSKTLPDGVTDVGSEDGLSELSDTDGGNTKYTNLAIDSDDEQNSNSDGLTKVGKELSRQVSTISSLSSTGSENSEIFSGKDEGESSKQINETKEIRDPSQKAVPNPLEPSGNDSSSSVNSPPSTGNNRKRGYSFWQTSLDLLSPVGLGRKLSSVTNMNDYDKLPDSDENEKNGNTGKNITTSSTNSSATSNGNTGSKKTNPQRQMSALQASPNTSITVPQTNDNPLGIIPGRAYIMVAGDLNYRLQNISCEDTLLAIAQAGEKDIQLRKQFTESSSLHGSDPVTVNCQEPWQVLLDADQMRQELNNNYNLLPGFVEAPISFPPTYRRKKGVSSIFLRRQGDHRDLTKVKEAFATVVRKTANGEIVSAVNTDAANTMNNETDPLLPNMDDGSSNNNNSNTSSLQPKKSELRVPSYTDRVLVRNPLLAGVPVSVDTFNQQRNKRKSRRLSKRMGGSSTPLATEIRPNSVLSPSSPSVNLATDPVEPSGESNDNSPIRNGTNSLSNDSNSPGTSETFIPLPPLRCIYYDSCDTVSVSDHAPIASLWELSFTNAASTTTKTNRTTGTIVPYGPVHLDKLSAINHPAHSPSSVSNESLSLSTNHSKDKQRTENSYEYTCLPPFPFEIPAPVTVLDQHKDSEVSKNSTENSDNLSNNPNYEKKELLIPTKPTMVDSAITMTKLDRKPPTGKVSPGNTKIGKEKYSAVENSDDNMILDTDGLDPLPLSILQSYLPPSKSNTDQSNGAHTMTYPIVSLLPPSDPLFNTQRRANIAYANIHGPVVLEQLRNELSRRQEPLEKDETETKLSSVVESYTTAERIFRTITKDSAFPFYEYEKENNIEAINDYLLKLGLVPPPSSFPSSGSTSTGLSIRSSATVVQRSNNKLPSSNNNSSPGKVSTAMVLPPSLSTVPLDILPNHIREQLTKKLKESSGSDNTTVSSIIKEQDKTMSLGDTENIKEPEEPSSSFVTVTVPSVVDSKLVTKTIPSVVSNKNSNNNTESNQAIKVISVPLKSSNVPLPAVTPARTPSESFSNARNIWQVRTSKQ